MLSPHLNYGGPWERARQSLIDDIRGIAAAINARWAATFGAGNTLIVSAGGTGDNTLAAHGVLVGEDTDPVAVVGPGAANTVLHGAGSAADPVFTPVVEGDLALTDITTANVTSAKHGFAPKSPGDAAKFLNGAATPDYITVTAADIGSGAALTKTDDTNVTATVTGTPASALLKAVNIALGWAGLLGLARGGTHTDLSGTGGASKFLKQASLGSDITVVQVDATDLSGAAALTTADDTNMSLTAGGTPATALLRAVSLTLAWVGTLARSRGGMGNGSSTAHGVLLGNGASAVAVTAVGATNTLLHGNTGADPTYSAVVEADLSLSDVTTDDVSITKHGFAPKAPNDATKFLDGTGAYTVPPSGGTTAYAPGTTSIADGHFLVMSNHLILTSTQRLTAAGNARLRLTT